VDHDALIAVLEGVLLTSRTPVTAAALVEAIAEEDVTCERAEHALEELCQLWSGPARGLQLERVAGGWRVVTPPQLDPYVRAFHGLSARQRLSQAALETLAIVAHRQPVTLPEINFIRGANSAAVMRTLLDRGLVRLAGRKAVVGKPFLYRTTKDFLIHFGLDRIEDLPDPESLVQEDSALVE